MLFLDEPTTGLDPRSRSDLWDMLRGLVAEGTTLLLTTQYLEEADQLADNIVVIDHGRIIAQGTPLQLKQQAGNASLSSRSPTPRTCPRRGNCWPVPAPRCASTSVRDSSPRRPTASPS